MASFARGLEDQVTCSICLESFTDPRVLPCLHTYCTHCLEKLVQTNSNKNVLVCPDCRVELEIPDGDVSKLKVNFWINNLLSVLTLKSEEQSNKLLCEMCVRQEKATGRCTECCEFMCELCITSHTNMRATQRHKVVSLEEIKRAGIPLTKKPLPCPKHQKTLKLFCDTCKELVCRDCTIVEHRGHEYVFTYDVGEREKNAIHAVIEKANEKAKHVKAVLAAVQNVQRQLEVETEQVLQEADQFIDEQITKLETIRSDLKQKVNGIHSDRSKQLVAQENELEITLASIKSSVDFADRVCREGSDTDVLSIRNEVTSRLSHLAEKALDSKPCVHSDVELYVNREYWDVMADKVDIDDLSPDLQQCTVGTRKWGNMPVSINCAYYGNVNVDFIITLKNKAGKLVERPCNVEASVNQTKLSVTRRDDGTYKVKIKGISSYIGRTCKLAVTIDGKHIKSSPFYINVYTCRIKV